MQAQPAVRVSAGVTQIEIRPLALKTGYLYGLNSIPVLYLLLLIASF